MERMGTMIGVEGQNLSLTMQQVNRAFAVPLIIDLVPYSVVSMEHQDIYDLQAVLISEGERTFGAYRLKRKDSNGNGSLRILPF
jgi:hypothetical protein